MKIKHSLPLVLLCSLYIISCGDDDDPGVIVMEEELLGRIPCENGFADIYPCDNYDLIQSIICGSQNYIYFLRREFCNDSI
jgi:hypothetical protein